MSAEGSRTAEWRSHWPVVLAAAAGATLPSLYQYSTGLMIGPLEREFGWTRAEISSGPAIVAVASVALTPFLGNAIDRFGPRRFALFGTLLFSIALASLSTATSSIWSWWGLWAALSLTSVCISLTVWSAAVASLFSASRGLALAVTLSATGLGSMLVPITVNQLIESLGWRLAYVALSGLWFVVTMPLIALFFYGASDKQRTSRYPDRRPEAASAAPAPFRQALLSRRYIQLLVATCCVILVTSGMIPNIVPILAEEGYSTASAAALASLVGLGSIIGRLSGGFVIDRVNGNLVGAVGVSMPILSILVLLSIPQSTVAVTAAIFILGLASGIEFDAVGYLTARHFGVRIFGTLFGTLVGVINLVAATGPLLTNYVFDVTHSYSPALWAFIPISALSCILFLTLGPYPPEEHISESTTS